MNLLVMNCGVSGSEMSQTCMIEPKSGVTVMASSPVVAMRYESVVGGGSVSTNGLNVLKVLRKGCWLVSSGDVYSWSKPCSSMSLTCVVTSTAYSLLPPRLGDGCRST